MPKAGKPTAGKSAIGFHAIPKAGKPPAGKPAAGLRLVAWSLRL